MKKENFYKDNTNQSYYKWILLAFLWCAFFLQQGTRQIYNAILPQIQDYMAVDSFEMGIVGTVFTFTYGISVPFAGFASDFMSRKWMIISAIAIFSLGIFVSGTISMIAMMVLSYGLINGIGQAVFSPSACSLLGQAHKETRSTAFSIFQMALYIGIIACSYGAGWLASLNSISDIEGWRLPFLMLGALGLPLAFILIFVMRDMPHETTSSEEQATMKDAIFMMFKKPSAIILSLTFACHVYVDCGFKTWMPTLFQERFSMDAANAALNSVLWHYIGAFIGVTLACRFSDKIALRRPIVRFEIAMIGLLGAIPFIAIMANAQSQLVCFIALFLFGVFRGAYDSNLFATLYAVVAPRYRASATGIFLCIAFVFGSMSPALLGYIRDHSTLSMGMTSLGVFYFTGGLLVFIARKFFFAKDYVD